MKVMNDRLLPLVAEQVCVYRRASADPGFLESNYDDKCPWYDVRKKLRLQSVLGVLELCVSPEASHER